MRLLTDDNISRMLTHAWGETSAKRQRAEVADEPDEEETEIRMAEQGKDSQVPQTDLDARFEAYRALQDHRWEETQLRWATWESRLDQQQADLRQDRAEQR